MTIKTHISSIALAAMIATGAGAALAEGTVTVYTAAPQNFVDALVPMYEEASGNKVEIIKAGSGELLNRLTAESESPVADVIWSVDGTVIDFNPDLFSPYSSKHADAIVPDLAKSDLWTPFTAVVMVFVVNPDKLGDVPVPASWADLAKPEYDDLISSARADKSGSAFIQFATVLQAFGGEEAGWDVYKGMLGNFVLSDSSGAVPRFVNDGELPIGITLEDAALRYKEGGGPVQIVYPSEGTALAPDAMALVNGSANVEEGKSFIDFILSKEAQTVVASLGRRPVRGDVASNELLAPLSDITAVDYDFGWAAENRSRLVDTWGEVVLDVQ
ncbi:MAG: extracellular solute-binding protein [Stappiaceae bacterium]